MPRGRRSSAPGRLTRRPMRQAQRPLVLLRRCGLSRRCIAALLATALGDARRLAGAPAQVIELGAADLAAAHDLDRGQARRVEREDALDALAVRDLAQREAGVDAGVAAGDADALERL